MEDYDYTEFFGNYFRTHCKDPFWFLLIKWYAGVSQGHQKIICWNIVSKGQWAGWLCWCERTHWKKVLSIPTQVSLSRFKQHPLYCEIRTPRSWHQDCRYTNLGFHIQNPTSPLLLRKQVAPFFLLVDSYHRFIIEIPRNDSLPYLPSKFRIDKI